MDKKLIIVFGLPGAGKTYVAEIISKQFEYFSFNGDESLPDDMKSALFNKVMITDEMRYEFTGTMIDTIRGLLTKHDKVVVHQTFLKEFMRRQILAEFPYTRFILVETDNPVRELRYKRREYFNLGIDYLRHMSSLFEAPSLPFAPIANTQDGADVILRQLKEILSVAAT